MHRRAQVQLRNYLNYDGELTLVQRFTHCTHTICVPLPEAPVVSIKHKYRDGTMRYPDVAGLSRSGRILWVVEIRHTHKTRTQGTSRTALVRGGRADTRRSSGDQRLPGPPRSANLRLVGPACAKILDDRWHDRGRVTEPSSVPRITDYFR